MILANYKLYLKSSHKIQSVIKCNVVHDICIQMLLHMYIIINKKLYEINSILLSIKT